MINYENSIVQEDLMFLISSEVDFKELKNTTILVTGATGMLASYCCFLLFYLNETQNYGINIILLARKEEKLKKVYGDLLNKAEVILQDVCMPIAYAGKIDYIIHAAGAASPYFIKNDPVGIIRANTEGTRNVLELSRNTQNCKVVFLSTREIYGEVEGVDKISEENMGVLDPLDARSCYPESKRLAEALLKAYATQFTISFNTLRIAHSYGPGMQIDHDGRVMSDFIKDAVNQRDIVLKSTGEMERAFCYISDAVSAIFKVLILGENRTAYNIANELEPVKVKELAAKILVLTGSEKAIEFDLPTDKSGYTTYKRIPLDTTRVEKLGWKPQVSLDIGLSKTINSFHE
ncbi:MAG TPA: NAD-dependent epimerase/dehydratase family protein [Chitinophagaceae bacterium]|nr:NAD-dependent epimerase/dehydratase family protein [Chitinophagaceae bacterium]